MTDCLIIGFNDTNFDDYVNMVRSMGTDSGAYKDLNLAFIEHENKPYRAMDILNHFYFEDKPKDTRPFHFADFLWPVITYLGTYLTHRGFTFDYINLFHLEKEKLREKLLNDEILTVAITTTLYVVPQPILEIISFVRQYNSKVKIIVGGPYIANAAKKTDRLMLEQQLKSMDADFYVFSAEGEAALVNLLGALKKESSIDAVENIAYKNGAHYVFTPSSIESNSLEENLVNYTLFPAEETGGFVSTRTAKSCPFSCSFCNFPQQAGKYKYTGVELVERELDAIRDMGNVTTLTFIDDTFNVPRERFKEILRMMIRNKYEFKWNSMYRADHGDEEIIELMGRAGCEGVFMGVESASDKMLKIMNKAATRQDYLKSIPLLKQAGILAHANLFIGFPGETYETVQESVDFIKEAKPETYSVQLWYANPLTPIWNKREEYGIQGASFNWSHKTMDSQTACDLIDKAFLSIDESTFLPQQGFFQWCLFYLQRKGMELEQIRTFMRSFNAIIKEKLLYPHKRNASPELIENLRRSSQFDKPAQLDMDVIELYSGAKYVAAEKFCMEEFAKPQPPSALHALRNDNESLTKTWFEKSFSVDTTLLQPLRAGSATSFFEPMLTALGVLLWRLNGLEDVEMIVADGGREATPGVMPLRISPSWGAKFEDLVEQVREKTFAGRMHKTFALQILGNALRMKQFGGSAHVFEVGFMFVDADGRQPDASMEGCLEYHPQIERDLALILEVVQNGDERLELKFKTRLSAATTDKLATYLRSILEEVARNPEISLLDIPVQDEQAGVVANVSDLQSSYGAETFEF